jgi:RNA polymerase sigma factor (sigma-70 family)
MSSVIEKPAALADPDPATPDDAALVRRCLAGDASAWAALVGRYQRLVYAIVRRMGLDEHTAADVFQTVFARLMEQLPRVKDPQRLQAWIVTTAKREGLLLLRTSRRTVSMTRVDESGTESDDWDLPDETPIAEEALAALQQQHQVRLAMERLDARCRDLLTLVFRDEDDTLTYEEVSRRLGLPVGSIGPTRSRCLDKLRRLMC